MRRRMALALPALLLGAGAQAQGVSSRPVTMVVPFPPGGSTDVAARLIAERMAPVLGERVVIENRGGGATVVGTDYVAHANPDGHTVLMASGTASTINPIIHRNLPYKPEDFAPVSLVAKLPFAIVVRPGLPQDLAGLVALAKQRPGQINHGTNGPSSFNNIAMALVNEALGIHTQDVTYRGDSAQLNDFAGGRLDLLVVGGSTGIAAERNGQGKVIASTGERRFPFMPDVPTVSELAPGCVAQTWFCLLAPARTPRAAIDKLSAAAQAAAAQPGFKERMLAEGQFAEGSSPEALGRFLDAEMARWRPVLQRLDIRVD
jgi:tripartite-type tricarboxylate transporter receptor subunit TctC